jgi:hypothetical protein
MTAATDQELADRVRDAVDALNVAMHEASRAGLTCNLEIQDIRSFAGAETALVRATVARPL